MADLYELSISLDLRAKLSPDEYDELRWHLGLGPEPETLRITPGLARHAEEGAEPLLGDRGAACWIGGALMADLVQPSEAWQAPWALTVRQEVHPDSFDDLEPLVRWLAGLAADGHRPGPGRVRVGWTRFHESDVFEPLEVRDGTVHWP